MFLSKSTYAKTGSTFVKNTLRLSEKKKKKTDSHLNC